jgi:hypothetical protein
MISKLIGKLMKQSMKDDEKLFEFSKSLFTASFTGLSILIAMLLVLRSMNAPVDNSTCLLPQLTNVLPEHFTCLDYALGSLFLAVFSSLASMIYYYKRHLSGLSKIYLIVSVLAIIFSPGILMLSFFSGLWKFSDWIYIFIDMVLVALFVLLPILYKKYVNKNYEKIIS